MARVYEGRLDSLAGVSTRVAVKVIHPDFASDPGFQELFVGEARISARLEHPNLVRVQQFNQEGELLYLVMEFIEGFTLRKLISHARRTKSPVPTALIAEIGRQVCEGLHYAHTLQGDDDEVLALVHRDVKPSNLMVNHQGVVKVLDFGISSVRGSAEAAGDGGVKGTWGYMSLEQAHGQGVGPAADIFGLGAVLYELSTGEPLFPERDNDRIRQGLVNDEAARRAASGARAELAPVLVRALQRDPAGRYPSAAAFGRALSALIPAPMQTHDALVQLAAELRAAEGSTQAGAQERIRSFSTIGAAGAVPSPGLPVRVGDAHGPRRDRPAAVSPPRRSSILWAFGFGGFALVGLGIMSFAGWQLYRSAVAPPPSPPPDLALFAEPPPAAAPIAPPALEPAAPKPKPATAPAAAVPAPAPAPKAVPVVAAAPRPAVTQTGFLSLGSEPSAEILINGAFVKRTPMIRHELPAGSYTVKLIAEGAEPKSFKVTVSAGTESRKIWNFEEAAWVDE